MSERNRLILRLGLSVIVAFGLSLACTWLVHLHLTKREAYRLIDTIFASVEDEIEDCVNERLVRQCMAVRERLDEGFPTDVASLQELAQTLRVTEIYVADEKGDLIFSSDASLLARTNALGEVTHPAFNFIRAGGQAAEMMRLVDTLETEYCQPFGPNAATGAWRKYVAVWRPQGGFVEIGCDGAALRGLSRSSLVDLFKNWRVCGEGGIVVTTIAGLVLSDYAEPNREGTQWVEPDDSFYWARRDVDSFPVYVLIPKISAAVQRDVLVGATALLNASALILVSILVAIVITAFVRRQLRMQAAKELRMAKDIQLAALPNVFPPFPDVTRFDIWASMETAKEVGGDFYDFYFTGQDHVLFLIADVSGKGVPAAMFMMRAKTLIKSAAQTGKPLAQVFEEVNDALCDGNTSNTFVTAWAGELNVMTGQVTYVNAGHNPPVARLDGKVDLLRSRPSLVLGAMPGVHYRSGEVQLAPGDAIYLYTDGITEQPDARGELYGEARLLKVLHGYTYRQEQLLQAVLADVRAYAAGTEQADDCTQLVIRYRGGRPVLHRDYAPTMEDLAKATADLESALAEVPAKEQMQLMVAADEIFANIVRYSGATSWSLDVVRTCHPDGVRLIFSDDGKPFDPLDHRDPDTTLSAQDREVGGLGILIVKKTMSPVTYKRRNGKNILTMGKDYGN